MAKEKLVIKNVDETEVKDGSFFVKIQNSKVGDKLQMIEVDGQPELDKNCVVLGIKKDGAKNILILKINDSTLSDLDDKEKSFVIKIDEKEVHELTKPKIFPTPSQVKEFKEKLTIKPIE